MKTKRKSIKGMLLGAAVVFAAAILCLYLASTWVVRFYPNGELMTVAQYGLKVPGTGTRSPNGHYWGFWPNRKLMYSGHFSSSGYMDGIQRWYGNNGNEISRWAFVDGRPVDGVRTSYWPNGVTRAVETYLNGFKDGSQEYWSEQGEKIGSGRVAQGAPQEGIHITWPDDPARCAIRTFEISSWSHGRKEGYSKWFGYDDYGNLTNSESAYWVNGERLMSRAGKRTTLFSPSDSSRILIARHRDSGCLALEYRDPGLKKSCPDTACKEGVVCGYSDFVIRRVENALEILPKR